MNNNTNKHLVFVYGTLRKGYNNNKLIPGSAPFDKATTENKFIMTAYSGFPAVYKNDGTGTNGDATQITGEVYEVDDATLERLDGLEGHPEWYKREQVDVSIRHRRVTAWIYIMQGERQGPVIKSGDYNSWTRTSFARNINQHFEA